MNYYEHHIGDYDADTAHLSWAEDMAYTRLLRLFYRRERPIPADVAEACRLVRAATREQKQAVESVLREFFELQPDGWHQARCDMEIERYQRRTEHNQRVGKLGGRPKKQKPEENPPGYFREPEQNPPQTPDTRPQTPIEHPDDDTRSDPESVRVSMAGAVCVALKAEGIGGVNPGHPDLSTLLQQGAEVQNFVSAARMARDKGKGFAYVLGIVKGQLADSRQLAAAGRTTAAPTNGSSGSSARAARMAEAVPNLTRRPDQAGETFDMEATDVTPRRLG